LNDPASPNQNGIEPDNFCTIIGRVKSKMHTGYYIVLVEVLRKEASMMKRLKYVSRFAKDLSHDDIESLMIQSEHNNRNNEITGALMTLGDLFFQVIEGPEEKIDDLISKIQNDGRHQDVFVLGVEDKVPHRIFPNWALKKVELSSDSQTRIEPLTDILETVILHRDLTEKLASTLERAFWREMVDAEGGVA